jgi:phosphoenolpyruvate phosphomutase
MKKHTLRELLSRPDPITAVGAHDAISAKLVEVNQFDAVWVSSFGLSAAQKSMPDANVLTMTESLEVAKNIKAAVSIPVIADCDNGYGNALNVMRTAQEFSSAGIAGISIEDATFPKRCSLYGGKHELVSTQEMAGRIRAAKEATRDNPDFCLIARTEALIAGLGLEEAMRRADAYQAAGADALLIHSKSKSADEVLQFAKQWKGTLPLVVVPTMFPNASVTQLHESGFKIIIFANQALRASVAAMRHQLGILKKEGRAEVIDGAISPLPEIYDLVGVPQMQAREEAFLPQEKTEAISALILAAGFEEHLLPLIQDKPKTMLEIRGKTILDRQLHLLRSVGINKISVVRGYQGQAINPPGVTFFENQEFQSTGIAASLFAAEPALTGKTLVLYGDILFDRGILERLLESEEPVTLAVDRAWFDNNQSGLPTPIGTELVVTDQHPDTGRRFLPSSESLSIQKIGQKPEPKTAIGEFIGLGLFSPEGLEWLKSAHQTGARQKSEAPFQEAKTFSQASLTDLIQQVIDDGHPVKGMELYKGWLEVDTFEDYQKAWAKL